MSNSSLLGDFMKLLNMTVIETDGSSLLWSESSFSTEKYKAATNIIEA